MTPLLKGGIGLLTIGTVAGVGYAGSTYFSDSDKGKIEPPKSMSQLISDKFEYILLGPNDNWTENWKTYVEKNRDNPAGNDILGLEGWVRGGTKDLTEKLKLECQKLSASKISSNYEYVTEYCSRPVNIADEAKKEGVVVIKADDASEDEKAWKTKIDNKAQISKHFADLGIEDNNALKAENLRQKCQEKTTMKKQERNYQKIYESYKAVCTNPKPA